MIADNCIRIVRDTSYFSLNINGFGIYAWKKANIVYQLRGIKFQLICFSCVETDEDEDASQKEMDKDIVVWRQHWEASYETYDSSFI